MRNLTVDHGATPEEARTAQELADRLSGVQELEKEKTDLNSAFRFILDRRDPDQKPIPEPRSKTWLFIAAFYVLAAYVTWQAMSEQTDMAPYLDPPYVSGSGPARK